MDDNSETIGVKGADYIKLTASIVSAFVSKNPVRPADMPGLLASIHAALSDLGTPNAAAAPPVQKLTPAQIRKSITPDALISFEDRRPYKTLRRHLTTRGLTPEAYREKWGLPRDYPMTAASYSEVRSAMAKSLGLGQLRRKYAAPKAAGAADTVSEKPKRAGRSRKAKAAEA